MCPLYQIMKKFNKKQTFSILTLGLGLSIGEQVILTDHLSQQTNTIAGNTDWFTQDRLFKRK